MVELLSSMADHVVKEGQDDVWVWLSDHTKGSSLKYVYIRLSSLGVVLIVRHIR